MPNRFKELFQRPERSNSSRGAAAGATHPAKHNTEQHAEQLGGMAPPWSTSDQQSNITPSTPSFHDFPSNSKDDKVYSRTISNINFEDDNSFGVQTIKEQRCENETCGKSIFATMTNHEYSILYDKTANRIKLTYYCALRDDFVDEVTEGFRLRPESGKCQFCAARILDEEAAWKFDCQADKIKGMDDPRYKEVYKESLGYLTDWTR
ncbi:hypothetical protein HYALB_00008376 [Hymenoscyphus albidus]|uniref:Uncharacterized protein n=1 Tax=Hymenoscyphus albidus TaxID=595503 RepID=A0A9N9LLX6_9HELO|nr:hypothetical protein HYALB_00008376 [Hymenoscyphus albidus]